MNNGDTSERRTAAVVGELRHRDVSTKDKCL
jgi:hypothetical protein